MFKNSVGSIWGTFVVPVPWLVAGGWGDGWCRCHGWWLVAGAMAGAVRCRCLSLVRFACIVWHISVCMHCVAHFCLLMGQMMIPNKGCIDVTML